MSWPRLRTSRTAVHTVLLVLFTIVKSLIWIGILPVFLVADEPAHFDNVQFRAERHRAPTYDNHGERIPKVMHDGAAPEVRALWDATIPKSYYRQHHSTALPQKLDTLALTPTGRDTDGQNPSIDYPGLYYQLALPFYKAFTTSNVVTRVESVRMLSLLFGLCAVLATYFAARLVVDDEILALVAAAVVALQPMASQQTAAVNNDAGMIGIAALLFYFQIRTLHALPRFPSLATLVGLVLSSLALVLTKPTGYGILPGSAVVVLAAAWVHWPDRRVRIATIVAAIAAVLVVAVALHRGFSPAALLPGDTHAPGENGHEHFLFFLDSLQPVYLDYLLRSTWGQFGWLDYSLNMVWLPRLRSVWFLVEVGTVVAIATWSLRQIGHAFWFRGSLLVFSIATTLGGVIFILYVEHRFRLIGAVGVIQGRNFLFVLPAFSIWMVVALAALVPARMRILTAAMIFTGALALHFASLLTIVRQHYVP